MRTVADFQSYQVLILTKEAMNEDQEGSYFQSYQVLILTSLPSATAPPHSRFQSYQVLILTWIKWKSIFPL